ncbi:HEAT repeat domain-containing protein [Kineosporia sp. NBRC 101731]|uniref:HEAT repeat domain-containing protein n=1 Tax=Kineosporia sp. NBRC 101731 TaxID=3032199 RepID=UPI0025579EAB|nr:HEAT repeat domain-containing protein [Kineosporia sp. NBRC 101731]
MDEVVESLIHHLSSDDAGFRMAVVEVLSRTTTATARRIPQLLHDPDPDIRILTVMVLSCLRTTQVSQWLGELVREDTNQRVVAAAIGELAALEGPGCLPVLYAARTRFPADPFIAFSVDQAAMMLEGEAW